MDTTLDGIRQSTFVRLCIALSFSLSVAFAWSHIIANTSTVFFLLALGTSALGTFVVAWRQFDKLLLMVVRQPGFCVLACILGACFSWGSYSLAGASMVLGGFSYGTKICYIIGYPATALFFLLLIEAIKIFADDVRSRIDGVDARVCLGAGIALFVLMMYCVSSDSQWYLQYDCVCSIDTGYLIEEVLPKISYYDIRHPILSLFAFPAWSTFFGLAKMVAPEQMVTPFCVIGIQALNIAMIVACAAMLKALTKNRMCLLLLFVSFPSVISAVGLEKYVLSTFFVVLTIYFLVFHERFASFGYAISIGIMPTNAFLFFVELVKKESFRKKLIRIGFAIVVGILLIVCSGHGDVLDPSVALDSIRAKHDEFGSGDYSIVGRVFAWANMIQGSFFPMSLNVGTSGWYAGAYIWPNLTTQVGFPFYVLFAFMLIGAVKGWSRFAVRASCVWTAFAFILFVVFDWAPHTSVLFAPLFYWSVILLFAEGLQFVCEKFGPRSVQMATIVIVAFTLLLSLLGLADLNWYVHEYL